jgi:3-hydroxyisobutyrate dehydrogenase-like beta-hydroxyacid dehydrogenase
VVGLGLMGRPVARTLIAAGHDVRGWNRSALDAGLTAGIPLCATLEEAAAADVSVLVLADSDAVDAVLPGLEPYLPAGRIVVDMGSSDPARSRVHAERLAAAGVGWVDAPVSGGPDGAEKGTLAIMAGGSEEDCAAVEPLLAALGRFVRVGGPGAGHTVKIVNQVIVGLTLQAVAEAIALAERAQVDPRLAQRALAGGSADSRVLQAHGTRMIDRDFAARATVQTMLKDARLALDLAGSVGLELPHLSDLASRWERLVADGMGGADCAALFSLLGDG